MLTLLKSTILKIFRSYGIGIYRIQPEHDISCQVSTILKFLDIKYLIDIGANEGQYASEVRRMGYTKHICSVEPLADAYSKLISRAKNDADWSVYDRVALGEKTGKQIINISENSVSSSLLEVKKDHIDACVGSRTIHQEEIMVIDINEFWQSISVVPSETLIKFDIQGYEYKVLKAFQALEEVKAVQIECAFANLYEGESNYSEIVSLLQDSGFKAWALMPGFTDNDTGRTLQCDIIMINTKIVEEYDEKAFSLLR